MIKLGGVSFKNPELQDTITSDYKQKVKRAYSGNIYSFRLREQIIFKLAFKDMYVTDALTLKNIIKTPNSFVYQDYNGTNHTVRCIDETFTKTLGKGNTCGEWVSFEIQLEVVQS